MYLDKVMHIPQQKERLKEIIKTAHQAHTKVMSRPLAEEGEGVEPKELIRRENKRYADADAIGHVKLLNPEAMGIYIAHNLSNMEWLQGIEPSHEVASTISLGVSEEDRTKLMEFLKTHPAYSQVFEAMIQSIQHYTVDLELLAARQKSEYVADLTGSLAMDSFNGLFVKKLMGRMLLASPEQERGTPTEETAKKGITYAFAKPNFFTEGDTQCPMSRRLKAIFDLDMYREPETGKVEVVGQSPSALIISMYRDFENKIWEKHVAEAVPKEESIPA